MPPVGDGNFAGFGDPTINALGQVAFQATLRNTSASTDTGIYFHNGTMLTNVARENANVPEGNGKFSGFGNLALNSAGQVAFQASLRDTSGVPTMTPASISTTAARVAQYC